MVESNSVVKNIPKVELHLHLESCFDIAAVKYLAEKYSVEIPNFLTNDNNGVISKNFKEFLTKSDWVARLIRSEADYEYITYNYLKYSAKQNVVYVELMVCPDYAYISGISYEVMINAISRSINKAEKEFGIVARINLLLIRHLSIENSLKILEDFKNYFNKYVVGISIAGDENSEVTKFKDFCEIINEFSELGLKITPHAGELSGPESIWECLDNFKVSRIGHGVRCIEDNSLVNRLIQDKISLEICVSSNIYLGVYKSFSDHPLRDLFDKGLLISLNSDDPPFFETNIFNEYEIAHKEFGFTTKELFRISLNAINNSFADLETKRFLYFKILDQFEN